MLRCKEISTFSSITKLSVGMVVYQFEIFYAAQQEKLLEEILGLAAG